MPINNMYYILYYLLYKLYLSQWTYYQYFEFIRYIIIRILMQTLLHETKKEMNNIIIIVKNDIIILKISKLVTIKDIILSKITLMDVAYT